MPSTGRSDYDAIFRETSIPTDEPRFFLRAQDQLAEGAVRAYAELAREAGIHPALVESAHRQADAMADWPVKKLPDPDFIPADRWDQLAYELSRRRWAGGLLSAEAVAERRGRNEVLQLVAEFFDGLTANGASLMGLSASASSVVQLNRLLLELKSGAAAPPQHPFVEELQRQLAVIRREHQQAQRQVAQLQEQLEHV